MGGSPGEQQWGEDAALRDPSGGGRSHSSLFSASKAAVRHPSLFSSRRRLLPRETQPTSPRGCVRSRAAAGSGGLMDLCGNS